MGKLALHQQVVVLPAGLPQLPCCRACSIARTDLRWDTNIPAAPLGEGLLQRVFQKNLFSVCWSQWVCGSTGNAEFGQVNQQCNQVLQVRPVQLDIQK